MGPLHLENFI